MLKEKSCCNLGSLNLYEFVKEKFTDGAYFDFPEFSEAIRIAANGLDDIIDENADRLPKELKDYKDNAKNWRNIGLGTYGYADMLMALGYKYGSEEAITFTDKLFYYMMSRSIYENSKRGYSKGDYPLCNTGKIMKSTIYKNHVTYDIDNFRNCSLLSIAPNGSIATMMGLSGGIEPEFALSYTRRTDNLKESYKIDAKVVKDYRKVNGNIKELPDYFVTSAEIPWKNRIDTQAIIQTHVDTAISSTVNLPKETPLEDIEGLYLYAWEKGLKGVTIYRSGCKREGILTTDNKTDKKNDNETTAVKSESASSHTVNSVDDLPRGYTVVAADKGIGMNNVVHSGCGKFYINTKFNMTDDKPYEIFIGKGSSGGCRCNLEAIGRMTSYALRNGAPAEGVIDQLKSVSECGAYIKRTALYHDTSKGRSCPSAIGYAIEEAIKDYNDLFVDDYDQIDTQEQESECNCDNCNNCNTCETEISRKCNTEEEPKIAEGRQCPECGEYTLIAEGGCDVCTSCGYSHCG